MSMPPPPSPPPGWGPQPGANGPWGVPGDARPPGYQPYPGWRPTREHPNGTTVLLLGIFSLALCGLLGPVAWVMGNRALREIDADPGVSYTNRSNITAGRSCGIVGTVFLALGVVGFVVVIVAALAGGG